MVANGARDADPARRRQPLQPCGDVDAVAIRREYPATSAARIAARRRVEAMACESPPQPKERIGTQLYHEAGPRHAFACSVLIDKSTVPEVMAPFPRFTGESRYPRLAWV